MKPLMNHVAVPLLLACGTFVMTTNVTAESYRFEASEPASIPDGTGSVSSIPFEVLLPGASNLIVTGVELELDIVHPWVGDLIVSLRSPSGIVTKIIDRNGQVSLGFPGPYGCGGDDISMVLAADATSVVDEVCSITDTPVLSGRLRPHDSFMNHLGSDPNGVWFIDLQDLQSGDSGSFVSAALVLEVEEDCDGDGVADECTCPGDLTGNKVIDGADLADLLSRWSQAGGPADLDGDGFVAGGDLAVLLAGWGACL